MTNVHFAELKELLEREVCAEIKLKRPIREDDIAFELAPPVVTIGWPAVELTSPQLRDRVPGIAIGLDGPVTDDGKEQIIPVCLACIVYSPGTLWEPEKLDVTKETGYQDLLNLIDRIVRTIRRADPITSRLVLAKPEIQWDAEAEPYGNYWLGSVTFTLSAAPLPGRGETDLL